jgi:hypothetical protein
MKKLTAFVEANVPQLISYAFFLNEDRTRMTVVAIHRDSAWLEYRRRTEFQKFASLIDLLRIEVYGWVSDAVLERLYQKARALGQAG